MTIKQKQKSRSRFRNHCLNADIEQQGCEYTIQTNLGGVNAQKTA